jgi:CheY-like chemotaxis protein
LEIRPPGADPDGCFHAGDERAPGHPGDPNAEAESENAEFGHTPIVGVTAHALTGDMERCLEAGMDDYLSKPISPEKLAAKIREWLPAEIAERMNQI